MIAASVANASTTAPTRTRSFCRIAKSSTAYTLPCQKVLQLLFQSSVDLFRHNKMQTSHLQMHGGGGAGSIQFPIGWLQLSRGPLPARIASSGRLENCETQAPAGPGLLLYSPKHTLARAGCH